MKDGKIILTQVKIVSANITLEKIKEKIKRIGVIEKDAEDAVKWARGNKICSYWKGNKLYFAIWNFTKFKNNQNYFWDW